MAQGFADDLPDSRFLVSAPAQRDLVIFLAFPVYAENADMADMVVATGIYTARNVDVQLANVLLIGRVGEDFLDLLSDRDRAGIGQVAIIEARQTIISVIRLSFAVASPAAASSR